MWYLSGKIETKILSFPQVGFMLTPQITTKVDLNDVTWAADNGRFNNPIAYSDEKFFYWLDQRKGLGTCLFACAPDTWGDSVKTLDESEPMLPVIRMHGYKAALVAQDGLENLRIPWDKFDALFIGGTDPWRSSTAVPALVHKAKSMDKWVHMGRVNSWRRIKYAASIGCDSVDGTYLKFGPDINIINLRKWTYRLQEGHQLGAML